MGSRRGGYRGDDAKSWYTVTGRGAPPGTETLMSKAMKGAGPGWHAVNANGEPVSGPWLSKVDAAMHAARKAAAAVVYWNGKAVVVA